MTISAFVSATPLFNGATRASSTTISSSSNNKCVTTSKASASDVVEQYFPAYRRDRAPTIDITPASVSVSMKPIQAFTTIDKNAPLLLDYSDPDEFIPDKPTPPSAISWPSGDGRSNPDFKGVPSQFDQPNLKTYGPFPDFLKRSCEL